MICRRTLRARPPERKASAVVEIAISLPVILLIVLASIEACSMLFLNQSLQAAAYEGVRVVVSKDGTQAASEARIRQVLEARQVAGASIEFEPGNPAALPRGSFITVEVSAPCGANGVGPSWFFAGKTVSAQCTMAKE